MASNLAFTSQGSGSPNPALSFNTIFPNATATTPQASALNKVQGLSPYSLTNTGLNSNPQALGTSDSTMAMAQPNTSNFQNTGSLGTSPIQQGPTAYNSGAGTIHSGLIPTLQSQGGSVSTTGVDGGVTKTTIAAPQTGESVAITGGADPNQTPVQTTPQSTPTSGVTFPGLIGSLANTSAQGSPTGQAITGNLANTSQSGNAFGQAQNQALANTATGNQTYANNAAQIGTQYGGNLQNIENEVAANSGAGLYSGSALSQGRAQQVAQAGSNLIGQETAAENAALAGNAQGLTAQQQQANAQNAAVGNANTQQGLVQSGLTSAGGLAQTQQGLIQSGLTSAGQLASPGNTNVTPPAGQVTTNTLTGQQYSNPALAPVGTQAFYSPQPAGTNGQPNTAGQGGTNTGNTPFTGGQVAGQEQLGATYAQNNATITAAQGIQQKINADITQNGINSLSSVNAANALNQWVQGNLSNPAYQNFFQDLTDYTQTIAPLIGVSGTITDMKTAIGQQLINSTASGQTIMQGLDNLNSLAINKNNAIAQAGNGGTPTGQSTSSNSSNTVTSGGYTFVKNPTTGQWEAQ